MSLEQYRITHLLRQQLKARAEHIALEGFEMAAPWDKVSWNEFNRISAAIAGTLIANGFEVQDRAVILSHNCPQWTCVDVGVIRARGVVVPVYPTSTLEQAAYIINDAGAKLLFVDNKAQYELACELESLCPTLNCVVVFDKQVTLKQPHHQHLDTLLEQTVPEEARTELASREQSATLDDLLTLIYTSGTTGDPKGVMLDQRNFASAMRQHQQKIPFSSDQVSLVFLPLSHVYERGWSFYVLSRGGRNVYLADTQRVKEAIAAVRPHTLCVVPRFLEKVYSAVQDKVARAGNGRRKLFAWALSVGERQFEVMQGRAKPSAWLSLQWRLADKLVYGKLRAALGGRLQLMPCGGAALDAKVSAFFAAINLPVLCGYGMTETTATVTCNTLDNRVTGSNGRCMPEVEVRLGAENEILVRGDTVMRGYFNRPEDTAEAFEDGWLRTGDAGYLDEQGNLFITDRIKELMKTSNGKYIAPQRVEGKVGCCPFIEQVAVVADARNYVTALIVPAFEALEAWAKQKGLSYESPLELIRHSHVVEHFEERLKHLQQELAGFEQIKKFTLLPEAFSMEAGLITPTLKLRRKMIYHKYSREINAMYGG
ncbi:AMP-dependent synthetase/ligase [Shewanella algae]|uniref:AMP-dependent synthetase/ligase n=1 Tax=Shewanella algae TaxID=38313 RepID=UPI0010202BD3|nr:long-chain fatty acid--CoA ligase [Shewanella algae]EKT4487936.1 long-chain fatty acid--CoA ligase [Shewanella algae]MBC8794877.1 long-chain fatty acid--CoA ligase [Shewanella algae]MBO2550239.1 long-chain fatty acid--CoA ligase [Shewanella algae]MBO2571497.1 long-chain fatty acid--CoA ligase [Shewanella algae]MBO2647595.1 long-chain fatty acid--CoA ligase [Shewanella algae]